MDSKSLTIHFFLLSRRKISSTYFVDVFLHPNSITLLLFG